MSDRAASWLSTFSAAARSFRLWPFALVLGLCSLAFLFGEQYPVTRFPMYDKFPDHTYYVYVGDKNGDPIPVKELTGINTSKLKKPYDKEIGLAREILKKRKLELTPAERREAGERALRKLFLDAPPAGQEELRSLAPLQLFHVWIYSEDGQSDERPAESVASYTPEPVPEDQ